MHSLRKWFYRPKKEDSSKLALFYWADEELTMVAAELDSFDGRTDPDRCSILVSQLRMCQDKVLSICNDIMDDAIPDMRANRDFRTKFPDDVLHENLAGQLWFGAECLAAGSNIIHRELESASMRPLAKALTRSLENVRCLLREQSLKNSTYSDKVRESLRIFDRLFAEFELCYVGAMVPIKSAKEYHLQQEIVVLFSETLIRALKLSLVTQEMIDDYDPSLMFTIPRLAIVWGLLLYPDGPFNVERESADLSELFRPFCNLLFKIRDLLWTLTDPELHTLEKMLCSQDEPKIDEKSTASEVIPPDAGYINKSSQKHLNCKQFIHDFYAYNFGVPSTESNLPDHVNKCLKEDTRSNDSKHSKRSRNSGFEFGLEFRQGSELQGNCNKASQALESEIDTLVSDPDRNQSSANADNELNDSPSECNLSSGCCRTNLENSDERQHGSMSRCQNGNKHISPEHYSYRRFSNDDVEVEHASSLEGHLSRFHEKCSCGTHRSSREHLTPSRELMQQVMRQVEIVPQGQPIPGYSSSPDNSPRAYHHGLLSQSFPIHAEHGNPSDSSASDVPHRRSKDGHRPMRGRYARRHLTRLDCDMFPTQCYYSSNQAHTRQDGEVGSQWNLNPAYSSPLAIPRLQRVEDLSGASEATYSSCSSCQSVSSVSSAEWDSTSPDTSSYNSECQDDEEIALALQAAEIASRNKARSRFKNSGDLLHKLFVCISGVADQLQTNYASDLRNILKSVFDMNCTPTPLEESCDNSPQENGDNQNDSPYNGFGQPQLGITDAPLFNNNLLRDDEDDRDHSSVDSAEEVVADGTLTSSLVISEMEAENENVWEYRDLNSGPPEWIPDELSSQCMACKLQFTILRRRHHCRNCGKIFCSRCSSNTIPLPRFGHLKPVRVCNQCFMYQLTNLVMQL